MRRERWIILLAAFLILCIFGGSWLVYKSNHGGIQAVSVKEAELLKVKSVAKVKDKYDVIVVGTDPEGITAAVSAARNGLKTLLVDGKDRQILGGLMTLGWLNTIDMDADHDNNALTADGKRHVLNQGIFSEWYGMIEGDSFDVHTAANAFYDLVRKEKNIDLLMQTKEMQPITEIGSNGNKMIKGLTITEQDGKQMKVNAAAVIDATQDADIAYAAGVPFTFGREDLGDSQSKMAVTLVFRVKNVTDEVWKQIGKRLNDGSGATGANKMSAWGYSGMRAYQPLDPKLASMRGLNIGRQNDGTILINSLLLYNIDSFDANSRQKAIQQGQKELPYVVDFMKKTYPEFANIELDGTAPELYVRETRHMKGEYRLNIIDLLENKDQWDRIAFGSYESDIQPIDPSDKGTVVLAPHKYAIPFRSIVPLKVDGLLVVGRSASYDTLAHGSARVLPNGMAEGQAAGAAAKVASDHKITFRQLTTSKDQITQLQNLLNKQGMLIKPYTPKVEPYMNHKDYAGLKAAVYLGIAYGGYVNEFGLDKPVTKQGVINNLKRVKKKYPDVFTGKLVDDPDKQPVGLAQLSYTIAKSLNSKASLKQAQDELISKNLLTQATVDSIGNKQSLTNGDVYMVYKDVLSALVNLKL